MTMYCAKCGVRLGDTESYCPLCGTVAHHPELARDVAEPAYPRGKYPARPPRSFVGQVMLTELFLLPFIVVLLVDLQFNDAITWSGFVMGGLTVSYAMLVLPMWFRRPNPVIFVPCGFLAVALYLLYIDMVVAGGWFWPFALPLTGGVCLIFTAVVTLVRYVKKGYFFVFGGAAIALGGLMLLAEFLLKLTFGIHRFVGWSLYPLAALVLLGGFLIYLGINRNAREVMERKLFI
jgi:hypothetical protein